MIIFNNQTYLYATTKILDNCRHLLQIRFNQPLPYNIFSVYDQAKLLREYLTFSNEFLIVKQYSQPAGLGEQNSTNFSI
ncbi:unnamed protein product [Rotaria sp. Silwood2]|nr:unnamed protein product [Rotaria sp. Silwood2]